MPGSAEHFVCVLVATRKAIAIEADWQVKLEASTVRMRNIFPLLSNNGNQQSAGNMGSYKSFTDFYDVTFLPALQRNFLTVGGRGYAFCQIN